MSDLPNLSALKYAELQKLAKDVGIKANMKSEKLMKALEEYYEKKGLLETGSQPSEPEKVLEEDTLPVTEKTDHDEDGLTEHIPVEKAVKVERQKRKLSDSADESKDEKETTKSGETESASNESRPSKRRRGTFEIVRAPEVCDTVEASEVGKKESLGEMIEVMKPEMTTEDLKDSLMAAIEKKVEKNLTKEDVKEGPSSQIPRFAAFLAKKKEEVKPITPGNKNWTKIHEKNFSKMDSIDVYLEKKKRRNVSISNSIKRARETANKTREAMLKLKSHKTPEPNMVKKGLPLPFKSPFKPIVTSTSSMKLKFGDNAKTPVFGGRKTPGLLKTPTAGNSVIRPSSVRNSPRTTEEVTIAPTIKVTKPEVQQKIEARKSIGALNKTIQTEKRKSCVTPFKPFNLTLDDQSAKKTFDLKASLSKPLTWKPYTGKLKPIENRPKTDVKSKNHNIEIKAAPKKTSQALRIAEAKGRRANKKFNNQMKRRGIIA